MTGWGVLGCGVMLGAMCLVVGCEPSERSPLGKVTGSVTYRGEPLPQAQIVFHNPKGRSAVGQVVDGNIENVITYDVLNDGVPLGTLAVTLHPMMDRETTCHRALKPGERPKPPLKPPFPPRYSDPQKSGLEAEIVAGTNDLFFDLTD